MSLRLVRSGARLAASSSPSLIVLDRNLFRVRADRISGTKVLMTMLGGKVVRGDLRLAPLMPRSIWNGTISFGLAHVPIKLYSATESKTVSFHEVHLKDGAPIEHRRICSEEGKEVPYKEVVKGYEVAADEYVVLEKDEIAAAAGSRGKVIEIEEFVPGDEIDPVFYEKTYFVGAATTARPTACFHEALEETGRAGIGRFTFHNREYLAAVRSLDGVLALHTMRFHDELVDAGDLEVDDPAQGRRASGGRDGRASSWTRCTRSSTPTTTRTATARPCST